MKDATSGRIEWYIGVYRAPPALLDRPYQDCDRGTAYYKFDGRRERDMYSLGFLTRTVLVSLMGARRVTLELLKRGETTVVTS